MSNNRIFWAIEAVGLAPFNSTDWVTAHGVQNVGITTTFNLEQVFELGQLAIYQQIETVPDIEVTLEKAIDGYPLLYHLATRQYPSNDLVGRSNQRCQVAMSIFGDTQNSASGTPVSQVTMSGMYVSSVGYNFQVDGKSTENLTLVGNNKVWSSGAANFTGNLFTNTDLPLSLTSGTGGVQYRWNFIWDGTVTGTDINGQAITTNATILPPGDIQGISSSGTNDFNATTGSRSAHVQSIKVSADFGRDAIYELGRFSPYFRFIKWPVEVKTDIEVITTQGDMITAVDTAPTQTNKTIRVYTQEGTFINTGTSNVLASVTYGGADTGGGNATVTYSYVTYNTLIVTHPQDPT